MSNQSTNFKYQHGFSLVELMVGLVIGLLATLAVMQTLSSFEGNKRSTVGTTDAQTNGNIALYLVQRELQFAGYGSPLVNGTMPIIDPKNLANSFVFADYTGKTEQEIKTAIAAQVAAFNTKVAADSATVAQGTNFSALNCDTTSPAIDLDIDGDATTPKATSIVNDILTPVVITNGPNSDTITVRYGNTSRGGISAAINGKSGSTGLGVDNNLGCRNGDVVIVTRDKNPVCHAYMVTTSNADLDATHTRLDILGNANIDNSVLNLGDKVSCLGKVTTTTFDINSNKFQKNGLSVLDEIVSIQAQYGISATSNSELVAQYVDATGIWAKGTISVANRNRIKAVRIAVVARNNLLERKPVTQLCGANTGLADLCVFGGALDLSAALGNDWVNYRYRTYEMIVPLKNVIAASPQLL
jgi:type IV pilus assembly protein PilW